MGRFFIISISLYIICVSMYLLRYNKESVKTEDKTICLRFSHINTLDSKHLRQRK